MVNAVPVADRVELRFLYRPSYVKAVKAQRGYQFHGRGRQVYWSIPRDTFAAFVQAVGTGNVTAPRTLLAKPPRPKPDRPRVQCADCQRPLSLRSAVLGDADGAILCTYCFTNRLVQRGEVSAQYLTLFHRPRVRKDKEQLGVF
jgi:hypothetical protein